MQKHAKRRVGRGIGSGLGKTAGRGHKGRSRVRRLSQRWASKAVKCPAAPSAQARLQVASLKFNAEVTLADLDALVCGRGGSAGTQAKRVWWRNRQDREGHQDRRRSLRRSSSVVSVQRQAPRQPLRPPAVAWPEAGSGQSVATSAINRKTGKYGDLRRRLVFCCWRWSSIASGRIFPVPGIDPEQLQAVVQRSAGGILNLFNMFWWCASRFTVFALGSCRTSRHRSSCN